MTFPDRRPGKWTVISLTVLAALLPGCGRTINRSAERKIRDILPTYIGPAREWRAHVENAPERTLRGRLAHVTIDGTDVRFRETVTLANLHIDMRAVEVDEGRQQLKKVDSTIFSAVISEAALNKYIRAFPPPEEEPVRVKKVLLRDGEMHVEATRWLLGRAWPYTMTVEPKLTSSSHLAFAPERMAIMGLRVPLPASALQWFARRLSKGFDFSEFPFPVAISSFKVEPGRIVLSGTADVMASLNERIGLMQQQSNRNLEFLHAGEFGWKVEQSGDTFEGAFGER